MMETRNTEYRVVISDSKNKDFLDLIALLDIDLGERNGDLQSFYSAYNKVDYIKDVVIIYSDDLAVACGAFKEYDSSTVELKRIFVRKEYRQRGLAKIIVSTLEELASNRNYKSSILETGIKQKEAISLYKKQGYEVIDNYYPYIGMETSVCMRKELKNSSGIPHKHAMDMINLIPK